MLERAAAHLESGALLKAGSWDEKELEVLGRLFPLTMKPVLYVANVAEEDAAMELVLRKMRQEVKDAEREANRITQVCVFI